MSEKMDELDERKEFFRQLGLPRHEVYEWAKRSLEIPTFDAQSYRDRRHELRSNRVGQANADRQIFNEIKELYRRIIKRKSFEKPGGNRRSSSGEYLRKSRSIYSNHSRGGRSRSRHRSIEHLRKSRSVESNHSRRARSISCFTIDRPTPPPPSLSDYWQEQNRMQSGRMRSQSNSPIRGNSLEYIRTTEEYDSDVMMVENQGFSPEPPQHHFHRNSRSPDPPSDFNRNGRNRGSPEMAAMPLSYEHAKERGHPSEQIDFGEKDFIQREFQQFMQKVKNKTFKDDEKRDNNGTIPDSSLARPNVRQNSFQDGGPLNQRRTQTLSAPDPPILRSGDPQTHVGSRISTIPNPDQRGLIPIVPQSIPVRCNNFTSTPIIPPKPQLKWINPNLPQPLRPTLNTQNNFSVPTQNQFSINRSASDDRYQFPMPGQNRQMNFQTISGNQQHPNEPPSQQHIGQIAEYGKNPFSKPPYDRNPDIRTQQSETNYQSNPKSAPKFLSFYEKQMKERTLTDKLQSKAMTREEFRQEIKAINRNTMEKGLPYFKNPLFWRQWWKDNDWLANVIPKVNDKDREILDILKGNAGPFKNIPPKVKTRDILNFCEKTILNSYNNSNDEHIEDAYGFLKCKVISNQYTSERSQLALSKQNKKLSLYVSRLLNKAQMIRYYINIVDLWKSAYTLDNDSTAQDKSKAERLLKDKLFNWLVGLAFDEIKRYSMPMMNTRKKEDVYKEIFNLVSNVSSDNPAIVQTFFNPKSTQKYILEQMTTCNVYLRGKPYLNANAVHTFLLARIRLTNPAINKFLDANVMLEKDELLLKMENSPAVGMAYEAMLSKYSFRRDRLKYLVSIHPQLQLYKDIKGKRAFRAYVNADQNQFMCKFILLERLRRYGTFVDPTLPDDNIEQLESDHEMD